MKKILLHIRALPVYTPTDQSLFAAGNFNNWKTGDERFIFHRCADGTYQLELEFEGEELEFRINRGNWALAEGDEEARPNPVRRSKLMKEYNRIGIHISSWIDFRETHFQHSASSNVLVVHPAFSIPGLDRRRRITAYLPPGYWNSPASYPVLYMLDGQALFDEYQNPGGEWKIDESMNRLYQECKKEMIIVGIDHGGDTRIDEYSPWTNPQEGGGEGSIMAAFIARELKAYIDLHFKTLKTASHTGIMGSSMGGLLAYFTAMQYPEVFGWAGIFSPSLWFSENVFSLQPATANRQQRFFLSAGKNESETMTAEMLRLYLLLTSSGISEESIRLQLHSDGAHREWYWGREFIGALQWLYFDRNDLFAPERAYPYSPVQLHYFASRQLLLVTPDSRFSDPGIEISYASSGPIMRRKLFLCRNYLMIPPGEGNLHIRLFEKDYCVWKLIQEQGMEVLKIA